jgi:hypothetical protein
MKGKWQDFSPSSAERGSLVTAVTCMNASGMFVPPLIIFTGSYMKTELLDCAPPGSVAVYHKSGWIQTKIFTQWSKDFLSIIKPSKAIEIIDIA